MRLGPTLARWSAVTTPDAGRNVHATLQRKEVQADDMFSALVAHMNDALEIKHGTYENPVEVPAWLA